MNRKNALTPNFLHINKRFFLEWLKKTKGDLFLSFFIKSISVKILSDFPIGERDESKSAQ